MVRKVKVIDDFTSLSDESPVVHSLDKSPIEDLGLKIDTTTLDNKQLNRVRQVLGKFDHVFSKHSTDIWKRNLVTHTIELADQKHFKDKDTNYLAFL